MDVSVKLDVLRVPPRRIASLLTAIVALVLFACGLATPGTAAAQAVVCDVNVTISQSGSFSGRDPRTDCPGYTGTPDYIAGLTARQADSGNRDIYPSYGTGAADSPYANASANTWESNSGSFTFNYTPDRSPPLSATVVDTIKVDIRKSNTSTIASVYYHITIVPPAPTLTAVTPTMGTSAGGTSVVLNGTGFPQTGVSVSFGGTAATSVTVNSATQITAVAPAHSAGLVNVTVSTGGGTATRTNAYGYYDPATNAAAFSPGTIATNGVSSLTFTVTNPSTNPGTLGGVNFNAAIPANLTLSNVSNTCSGGTSSISGGTIRLTGASIGAGASCTVAANATSATAGSYSIVADGPDSTSPSTTGVNGNTATLTVQAPAPTVSSISPAGGSTGGGTPVTITGSNFVSGNTYTATFGTTTVAATYASATTLTATAPAGVGTVQVTVTNTTTSQAGTGSASYTYASPTVTGLSATSGPAGQTRAVTITGTNFTPSAQVAVGGTAATGVAYVSATQLTATLPAKAAGSYDVQVTTGSVTSAANPPADQYTYVAAPVVTSVAPNSGSTAGGTSVAISGSGFTGATSVTFGGTAAASFAVNGDGAITAVTPAHAAGAANVVVTTPGGTGQLTNGYTYVTVAPPAVTTQPQDQTVAVGATATFSAAASGSPSPSVQWQVSSDSGGGSFSDIAGATGTSYTTPATTAADNGKLFRAVFTNSQGTATTASATLTVVQAPTANSQSVTTSYQTAKAITLSGSDPNTPARTITYEVLTGPAHGTLTGTAPNLTFTPTPGYTGPDSFTFSVNNGVSSSAPATVTLNVGAAPLTISGTPPAGTRGQAYSYSLTAGGGTTPYSFAVTQGALPPGLTLATNGTSGTISGTPTGSGTYSARITVTDSANPAQSASGDYTFTIAAPTLAGSPPAGGLPGGTVGVAYSLNFTTSGGTAPYTYAVTAGAVPAGLTLAADGRLSGTPTMSGTQSFTVTATDSSAGGGGPYSVSTAYSIPIAAPTVTIQPATLPAAKVGTAYTQTMTANGGTAPYSYAISAGALPAGLTLNSTGVISGTPTAGGNFTFSVRATDSSTGVNAPFSGNRSYTLTVAAPTVAIAPDALPNATSRTAYSQTLTASGGTAPYSFGVTSGALPAGLVLASNGTLSGTPTAAGSYTFSVSTNDSSTGSGPYGTTSTYVLTVTAPTIAIAPTSLPAGTSRVAYSQTLTATGGTAPYSFAVTAGALPAGITLTTSGTLSGTATQAGSFSFTATATDANGNSGARSYTLAIAAPAIVIAPATLPAPTVGTAYSQTLSATGGTAPYSFAITAGALPAGLTLGTDGTLSGTPTAGGTFNFTATATDANGNAGARAYTVTAAAPTVAIAPDALPSGSRNVAYSQALVASGGTAPYSYAITAGALPAGLTLSQSGVLSGRPATAGSFTFTVSATDSSTGSGPYVGSRAYTLAIDAPTIAIAPATLPQATTRIAYSQTLSASGGTGPYAFAVTAGALPAGITLSAAGTLSGTPTAAGTFNFSATATDANGNAGTQQYALTVATPAIAIAPTSLPAGTTRVAYSQTLTATGGTAPYGFAVTAGALPAGITLATDGTLSGTPNASGSFTFTATVTDANGNTGSRSYTLAIGAPTIAVSPAALPASTVGAAYSQTLTASGGSGAYGFAITAGALPAGLTLGTNGTLSGTPTAGGKFDFTVQATDGDGNAGTRAYSLAVAAATVAVAPAALPDATRNVAYSASVTATGGTAPYSYAVTAGALPAGLTLATNGTISGRATQAGSFTFSVTATDSSTGTGPYAGTRSYTLAVSAPAIAFAPQTLPQGTTRVAYSQTLTATGGTAPYSYAVTAGALPAGLTLATNGTLSGTPTTAGSFSFTATATDANGNTGAQQYTLTVVAPAIALSPQALPNPTVGIAYAATVSATGGTAPYVFTVTAGELPAGIVFNQGGALSGTPTAGGRFAFTVTATDANGNVGSLGYTLDVAAATVAVAPAQLPSGRSGVAYSQTLTASGGTAPYAYRVSSGALPDGLTLSTTGVVSGTPTRAGSFQFEATATDSSTGTGPYAGTTRYTLTIAAPTLSLASATLQRGAVGQPYAATLAATGGTAPYAYRVTSGTLPAGVALASDGTLSGTPSAGGDFAFGVTATDATDAGSSGPYTASADYRLSIVAPTLTLAPNALPNAQSGVAYAQKLAASGGTAPYSYAIGSGGLPAGLTLGADGALAGTPTQSGSFSFAVVATDASTGSGPYRVSQSFTLQVSAPTLTLTADALAGATVGQTYRAAVTASGGTAPYGYAVTAGSLPTGLALGTDGSISGTPTSGGTFAFTIGVTDSTSAANGGPYSATRSYSIAVAAPAFALSASSLPAGSLDATYSQRIDVSGGTAPYSYAVTAGTLPQGVTLARDGTLSGKPNAAGTYAFTVTVTDSSTGAGPYRVSRDYAFTVALPPAPTASNGASATVKGATTSAAQSVSIDLSALVSGAYDRIEITTQPSHGSVGIDASTAALSRTGQRYVATYTPAAGYVGTDGFGFVAVGPGGRSAEARVAVTVTGVAPTAPSIRGTTISGQATTLDLTAGASGGPFTAARIVSVSPSDAVSATLVEGGSVGNRTYQLRVTPGGRFSGTATVQFTISNAYGESAVGTATIAVAARPDPSADPGVRAVTTAEAEATRRFATTQIGNFLRRTEQLHGDGAGSTGSPMGMSLTGLPFSASPAVRPGVPDGVDMASMKSEHGRAVAAADIAANGFATDPAAGNLGGGFATGGGLRSAAAFPAAGSARSVRGGTAAAAGAASGSAQEAEVLAPDGSGRRIGSLALWSGGAISVGARDATTRRYRFTLSTGGLSGGADLKVANGVTVGIGGGYGSDVSRIGGGVARVESDSWVGVGYASLSPVPGLFVDGVVGAGGLDFDTRRTIAANKAVATGHRDGSMVFGSIAAGYDRTGGSLDLSAYGRVDYVNANLKAYQEEGGGLYGLAFDRRDLNSLSGILGLRGGVTMGIWSPHLRAEWRHEFNRAGAQALDYTGLSGYLYRIDGDGWLRDAYSVEVGTDILLGRWKVGAEVGGAFGQGSTVGTGRITIGRQF